MISRRKLLNGIGVVAFSLPLLLRLKPSFGANVVSNPACRHYWDVNRVFDDRAIREGWPCKRTIYRYACHFDGCDIWVQVNRSTDPTIIVVRSNDHEDYNAGCVSAFLSSLSFKRKNPQYGLPPCDLTGTEKARKASMV